MCITTPRISALTATVTSASVSTDDSVETIRTDLRSRLEDSTEGDEDESERQEHSGSRVPGSQKEEISLGSDPFAAHSCHQRTESMSSVASAVSSTMGMNDPPSGTTNLLDMSDEPPSIALTDSFDYAGVILSVSSVTAG